ncbi:hypothetical protein [Synechococcus sp. PCC 6312]|uniref:hypothetical protein n=1 Tax=Synechococcus sp. (strain ATCC 27167 / PCC 6312) TaxID=195253 RepID=UPI00029ECBFC|nr:hypothetical protein [Synechococcus sp. PCC 6312]AFY62173.1 hypothetical protein Syn6312_3123 [Synechococcus sp. PCC 6312]
MTFDRVSSILIGHSLVKSSNSNEPTHSSGWLANGAGCLVAVLIFPFSFIPAVWLAFAMGPMGCALPNNCSQGEKALKGVVSLVIFVGGGLGVPLAAGALAKGGIKTIQVNAVNRFKSQEDQDNSDDKSPKL